MGFHDPIWRCAYVFKMGGNQTTNYSERPISRFAQVDSTFQTNYQTAGFENGSLKVCVFFCVLFARSKNTIACSPGEFCGFLSTLDWRDGEMSKTSPVDLDREKILKFSEALSISAGQFGFSLVVIFSALVLIWWLCCLCLGRFCFISVLLENHWILVEHGHANSAKKNKRKPQEWDKLICQTLQTS